MFVVKFRHLFFYANYINDLGETEIHFKPHANCIIVTGQIVLHLMSHANYILFYSIWIHLMFMQITLIFLLILAIPLMFYANYI